MLRHTPSHEDLEAQKIAVQSRLLQACLILLIIITILLGICLFIILLKLYPTLCIEGTYFQRLKGILLFITLTTAYFIYLVIVIYSYILLSQN